MPDNKGLMSQSDAARIQSTQAKGGGDMSSGGFAARAQSAGDRNANANAGAGAGSGQNAGGSHGNTGTSSTGGKK